MSFLDLHRSPGPRLILALEILVVLVLAAQAARLLWVFAAPVGAVSAPARAPRPPVDLSVLARSDVFGATGGAAGGSAIDGFRLFGVRSGGPGGGSAIIAGPDGVQKSYAVGETIADGVTLASVAADHVELSRGGARATLSFPVSQ
ncbi:type II secretion pathway protein C [Caulobacter sp. SL161]|uniref:type II secretion system protein N n=1 Tax=Caulobacter sp. SL161 TaxID=2995156 RepID=UPI0022739C43|nr:type II secretion system protein N [Caulobacter sp. SL161]MCY1646227.1 type II secretion pathway protein C [Caulobacter sp. SL161]